MSPQPELVTWPPSCKGVWEREHLPKGNGIITFDLDINGSSSRLGTLSPTKQFFWKKRRKEMALTLLSAMLL